MPRFGDKKAGQIEVKVPARLEIRRRRVKSKVTQTADFEWAVERHAADVVFCRRLGRHGNLPHPFLLERDSNAFTQSIFRIPVPMVQASHCNELTRGHGSFARSSKMKPF